MKITDTLIVINSSGRAAKVKTHVSFPQDSIPWVIAVPVDQVAEYEELYPERILGIPKGVATYLPSQRQWVLETLGTKFKYVWLMDDDLTFFTRAVGTTSLVKSTKADVAEMFATVRKHLSEVPMVGISTRLGNNRVSDSTADVGRVTRCYAMDTAVFRSVGAVFNPFEPFVAEDFHMTLCWLNAGHKNRIVFDYAQEDVGSNANGGCSAYRTAEVQRTTAFWMTQNHPEVAVKGKLTKTSWDSFEIKGGKKFRVDMVVQWKKAYKPKKVMNKTTGLSRWL